MLGNEHYSDMRPPPEGGGLLTRLKIAIVVILILSSILVAAILLSTKTNCASPNADCYKAVPISMPNVTGIPDPTPNVVDSPVPTPNVIGSPAPTPNVTNNPDSSGSGGGGGGSGSGGGSFGPTPTPVPTSAPTTPTEHVIFVAFENHGYNAVTSGGPYFNYLAQTYGIATNFSDLKHAGFSITSGNTSWNGVDKCGTDTANWGSDNSGNIFNLVANAGLSWGSWAEGFNGNYDPNSSSCGSGCIVRHVPAVFYPSNDNLKDYSDWDTRYLKGNEVPPSFSFITPNGCDSAHDCKVAIADNWLKNTFNLPVLLQKPWASDTVFIIWFDESESEHTGYLVFVSPQSIGKQHTGVVNPYNILTTMEWSLGLGNTGNNDATIYPPMKDLFG